MKLFIKHTFVFSFPLEHTQVQSNPPKAASPFPSKIDLVNECAARRLLLLLLLLHVPVPRVFSDS